MHIPLRRGAHITAFAALIALSFFLTGCISAKDKQAQLERVAKDWCQVVRASQVLPVYPLTEDILPGDVFLTTTRIGTEAQLFADKGFLPLDNLTVRLPIEDALDDFYSKREFTIPGGDAPHFPRHAEWEAMPRAAFPSYSFDIRRSGGLSLAIPVEGVPVGLNFLGAASATADITIADAYSYGLDIERLNPIVEKWAARNAAFLRPYGIARGGRLDDAVFLRIVSRIYFTGRVNIHLNDASQAGAEGKAGVNLDLPNLSTAPEKTNAERYTEVANSLNASLAGTEIGARVRVINVSSRGVTLDETFPSPLVIGYVAYDRAIYDDGTLGPAVPTYARITGLAPARAAELAAAGPLGGSPHTQTIINWYQQDRATRIPQIKKWMADNGLATVDPTLFINGAKYAPQHEKMIHDLGI